ncbi:MAG: hypothetical protein K8R02_09185 [Anaerohalosphaeraceae bacterium]|nr:hypothetical protein [Anaerohalosphaeraceae bacterium]
MQMSSKKAGGVSLTALIVSIIFFLAVLILSRVTNVFALYALSWQILAAVIIWAVLVVQFYLRKLAEQEKLDTAQLAASGSSDTIFEAQKNHAEMFAVAQNRLNVFEKWFLPFFSLVVAAYEIGIGIYLIRIAAGNEFVEPSTSRLLGAVLMVAIAFLSFLFSLFATGMSQEQRWRPLRAGGSYLLAVAVLAFLAAVGLALGQYKIYIVITVLNWAVPIIILLLGAEAALHILLDIYRPRFKGQYSSCAFDSRILAVFASPGNILHTASGAIDYQFGFKVSQTWFFKVLERAIVPLILVATVVLYLSSSLLIVSPGYEAVIERMGNPVDANGAVRQVGAGLTIKLPWPFDIAYEFPTQKIQQISIGFVPEDEETLSKRPLLWGEEHYKKEYNLLVASESKESQEKGAVPVSIIRAAVPVQYRVSDLHSYLYNYEDSAKVLKSICYREVIKFAAGSRVEPESEMDDSQESLLGAGRSRAAAELLAIVQKRADEMGLGVEIVFMGMQGFHPPPDVAKDFQAVIGSVQQKQAKILWAIAQRDKILTNNVGSVKAANSLYKLAGELFGANRGEKDSEKIKAQLDTEFALASGELYAKLRAAKSYAYEKSVSAEATGKRFAGQLKAYNSSEQIYTHELKMGMLEEAIGNIRKYIVATEGDTQVTIIDLQEKLVPSLYDIEAVP